MEVKNALSMNKGEGKTSYYYNSTFTGVVARRCKFALDNAVQSIFTNDSLMSIEVLKVADLGCCTGPNTFEVMSTVIDSVENRRKDKNDDHRVLPEFQFFLNDLWSNDFNTLFKGLATVCQGYNEHLSCFAMAAPGSFYDRLFPKNSIHLVHSAYSTHWLSKVPDLRDEKGLPINKGKIYISKTSPPAVREAYLAQFEGDFTLFLKLRCQEMLSNGRVVLTLHGRQSPDPTSKESNYQWELLAEALSDMVSQGLIDEEKLDSFDVPYYSPTPEEVKKVIEQEESFALELIESFPTEPREIYGDGAEPMRKYANVIRAYTEPVISNQFGAQVLDELYNKFASFMVRDLSKDTEPYKVVTVVIVLRKM